MKSINTQTESTDRPRGRPAGSKSGELQKQVLDDAEHLFAENGYAATSIRQLAERSGVNPALVHYYFGTKRDLLIAVMDRTLRPMAEGIAALRESGSDRVEDFIKLFFSMAEKHPAMPKLMTREVLLSGGEIQDIFARDYAPRIGGALPGLLSREQKKGRIDPDIEPGAASLMLMSLCVFPFIARPVAERVLGIQYSQQGLQDYMQQVTALIDGGMKV